MKKKLIIVAILIMSVGFAIVSTNLIINGTSTIGKTTFDVYFSGAVVDGYDKTNEVVKDKKNIQFTSKNLLFTNDTSELIYEVTNNSSNYDAKVNVSCTNPSNKITVEEVPKSLTVHAKQIETGSIVVTLNEMAVDPEDVVITCTLNVNAEERTSLATDEIIVPGSYRLMGTLYDNNNNPLSDQYLAIYSETKHIVKTDMNGFFYVGNLERGIHEIYLINESDKDLSDTEIKTKPKGITSTNRNDVIIFTNNYKIKNTNIDTTTIMYTITFNAMDKNIPNQTKYISKGNTYGTLPTLEKEHYTFNGWYTSSTLQDETTNVNNTDTYNIEASQTLYAKWIPVEYEITYNLSGGTATNLGNYNVETNTFTLNNPTKTGYTFAGWTGTGLSSASTSVNIEKGSTGNRSYTATYTVNNYYLTLTIGTGIQSISYSTNDGSSYTTVTSNQNVPVAYGSKVRCYATAAANYKYDTYNSTSKYWRGTMGTSGLSFSPTGTQPVTFTVDSNQFYTDRNGKETGDSCNNAGIGCACYYIKNNPSNFTYGSYTNCNINQSSSTCYYWIGYGGSGSWTNTDQFSCSDLSYNGFKVWVGYIIFSEYNNGLYSARCSASITCTN